MSLPLKDLRAGIPPEWHTVLAAYANAHGMEIQEVVRSILAPWVQHQINAATIMHEALVRDGLIPESAGPRRNGSE